MIFSLMMLLVIRIHCLVNEINCGQGCSQCIRGECQECLEGWIFQSQMETKCEPMTKTIDGKLISFGDCYNILESNDYALELELYQQDQCFKYYNIKLNNYPFICGDEIIQGDEECDDGNINPYDGCHQCILSCLEGCSICIQGVCKGCQKGWIYQSINNQCVQELFQEKIESIVNQFPKFCSKPLCIECIEDLCVKCFDNYNLNILTNTCDSQCGDSITNGNEQCDDGNNDFNDGCYECKRVNYQQCNQKCSFCYKGECQNCNYGYSLQNNECVTICGDNLVNKDLEQIEQCDNPDSDGCINCIVQSEYLCIELDYSLCWSCDDKCTQCIKTNQKLECQECQKGYYPKGIKCLDCLVNCITCHNEKDLCTSCYRDDCEICEITEGLYTDAKIGKCVPICGDGYFVKYYEQCDDGNNDDGDGCDSLCFIESLEDESKMTLNVTIEQPKNMTLTQQSQVKMIENAYSGFSYLIIFIAPVSILLGVFQYFWAVLEILSWINNFYFLNVQFPFNVETLFLKFDWSSFVNIPTYQQFNQPGCEYYFKSPDKFMRKNMDPLFINNAQVPFLFISLSVVLYSFALLAQKLILILDKLLSKEINVKSSKPFQLFKLKTNKLKTTMQTLQNQDETTHQESMIVVRNTKIVKLLLHSVQLLKSLENRVVQTISLCLLDITMAIVLQLLFATEFQYLVIAINEFLALLACMLVTYQLYQFYKVMNIHPELAKCPQFKMKYGSYYHGLNTEIQFGYLYNLIYYIRKVLYTFISVFCYYNPILQTSLCFFTFATGVILLLYRNPYDSKRQYIQQFIQEISVSIILLTTALFAYNDSTNQFSDQMKVILGWILIAFILVSLSLEIVSLIFEIIVSFYKFLKTTYRYIKNQRGQSLETENNTQMKEVKITQVFEKPHQMSTKYTRTILAQTK